MYAASSRDSVDFCNCSIFVPVPLFSPYFRINWVTAISSHAHVDKAILPVRSLRGYMGSLESAVNVYFMMKLDLSVNTRKYLREHAEKLYFNICGLCKEGRSQSRKCEQL